MRHFDSKEEKLYLEINIDSEKILEELKESFSKALGFAVNISYTSPDTIGFLIQRAARQEKALEKFIETVTIAQENVNEQKNDKKNDDNANVDSAGKSDQTQKNQNINPQEENK